ncbi:MAG: hypothetical protein WCJ33_09240 [Pseudomonadota bacterium]
MRNELIEKMKLEIANKITNFLQGQGIELYMAANDNVDSENPLIRLEAIEDNVLSGSKLLFEIRVVLGLLGKTWQCDSLIKGIYYTLHPHGLSLSELVVILMSMHVEHLDCNIEGMSHNRTIIRYVVEECQK